DERQVLGFPSEPCPDRTGDPLLKRLSGSVHHTIPHHRNPGTTGVFDVASCSPSVTDGDLTRYNARATGGCNLPVDEGKQSRSSAHHLKSAGRTAVGVRASLPA